MQMEPNAPWAIEPTKAELIGVVALVIPLSVIPRPEIARLRLRPERAESGTPSHVVCTRESGTVRPREAGAKTDS